MMSASRAASPSRVINSTLSEVGVPTIDTSFFSPSQTAQLKQVFNTNKSSKILLALDRISKVSQTRRSSTGRYATPSTRTPRLEWNNVKPESRDRLVEYFAANTGSYTNAELQSLKKLPVFALQDGSYTSLHPNPTTTTTTTTTTTLTQGGEAKNQEYYYLKQADTTLPDMIAGNSRILKRKQSSSQTALYNELGVAELSAVNLFQKFIVPEFDGLSRLDQSKFTEQLCNEWPTLKQNASLVETLKQLQFIPVNGHQQHAKPSELLDPRNQLLSNLFQNNPKLFPNGEYASKRWLNVLTELGLKNTLDKELYAKACAQMSIDFHATNDAALKKSAYTQCIFLLQHFNDNFTDLYSINLLKELSNIAYVPVVRPGSTHPEPMLVQWKECALHKDRHLIWTCKPIVLKALEPPRNTWDHLGLSNKQTPSDVMKHLRNICIASSSSTATNASSPLFLHPDVPSDIIRTVLEYCNDKWNGFSPSEQAELKTFPLLPIHGTLLVRPSRTFFRMEVPLPPFLFEVPRAYGPHETVLKQLGTKETPTIDDYIFFLNELKEEIQEQRLNPNELNAVVRVVHMLVKEYASGPNSPNKSGSRHGSGMSRGMRFVVPDNKGCLVYHDECVMSLKHYKDRISPNIIRTISALLNVRDMKTIDVPSIEDMVEERRVPSIGSLDTSDTLDTLDTLPTIKISEEWTNKVIQQCQELSMCTNIALKDIQDVVMNTNIGFVPTLHTKLYLKRALGRHSMGTDCTHVDNGSTTDEVGCWIDWMYQQQNTQTCIVLSESILKKYAGIVTVEQLVARCVMELLVELVLGGGNSGSSSGGGSGTATEGGASETLRTMSQLPTMTSMLSIQQQQGDARPQGDDAARSVMRLHGLPTHLDVEARRGVPGETLIPHDATCVKYTPLHPYSPGEIVAAVGINDRRSTTTVALTSVDTTTLVYGVVLRSSESMEHGVGRLQIRLINDDSRLQSTTLLSTEIFSFAPTTQSSATTPSNGSRSSNGSSGSSRSSNGSSRQKTGGTQTAETKNGHPAAAEPTSTKLLTNTGVNSQELMDAVSAILGSAGMPMRTDTKELMAETMDLRRETLKQQKTIQALEVSNDAYKERLLCKICMNADVDRMLMPSGKMICKGCVTKINGLCPFTRKNVDSVIKLYF